MSVPTVAEESPAVRVDHRQPADPVLAEQLGDLPSAARGRSSRALLLARRVQRPASDGPAPGAVRVREGAEGPGSGTWRPLRPPAPRSPHGCCSAPLGLTSPWSARGWVGVGGAGCGGLCGGSLRVATAWPSGRRPRVGARRGPAVVPALCCGWSCRDGSPCCCRRSCRLGLSGGLVWSGGGEVWGLSS